MGLDSGWLYYPCREIPAAQGQGHPALGKSGRFSDGISELDRVIGFL